MPLRPRGTKILLELLARAPDLRVVERPTCFRDRRRGASKLTFRQEIQFLAQILSLLQGRILRGASSLRPPPREPRS